MSQQEKLEQLENLLLTCSEKTLDICQIHGMLSALVCGPKTVRPTQWLGYLFPETSDFKKLLEVAEFEQIMELSVEIYEDILFAVRQGALEPWLKGQTPEAVGTEVIESWCMGFYYGMALHGDEWMENENEQLAGFVAPILYLANPQEATHEMDEEQREKLATQRPELIRSIRYGVSSVYDFFNLGKKPEEKKDFFGE